MSLRRKRKRQVIAGIALAKLLPVRKVAKTAAAAKAARTAARSTPVRVLAVAVAAGGVVAAVRKRRAQQAELDFGKPNESVPSHEALAGAREAAGAS